MKKIVSFLLAAMMVFSMMVCVSADANGGFIIDNHVERLEEAQPFFDGTTGNVLAIGAGFKGSNAASNPGKGNGTFYPKTTAIPAITPGKTYHVTLLAKGATADVTDFVYRLYTVALSSYTAYSGATGSGSDIDVWRQHFYTGTVSSSEWTRTGMKFTVAADNTAAADFQLTSNSFKTQNLILLDEYTVLEETSEISTNYTRPYVFSTKVTGASGVLKAGDKLTATAYTYDANSNVVPSVSFKWMKSTDGVKWDEIKTTAATVGTTVNAYKTYTATAEYTLTEDDKDSIIKAVATAESTGTVSGKATATDESDSVGELGLMNITVSISGEGTVKFGDDEIKNGGKASVAFGDPATFTITCDDSHMVSSVTYNNEALTAKDGKYTIESVKGNGTLKVIFSDIVTEVFVSPDGDDDNAGTIDAPFKSIERARSHIRSVKALGKKISGDYVVNLRGGVYHFSSTFKLDENDSGTEENGVVYKAYNNENVVFSGSKKLDYSAFKPVDGEMKQLLRSKTAREKVLVADLEDLGIDPVATYSYDIYPSVLKGVPVITYNDQNMKLSRWPNNIYDSRGWMSVFCGKDYEGTQVGSADEVMIAAYTSDIPSTWEYSMANSDIYIMGVMYQWYNNTMTKVTIDPEKKLITSADKSHLMDYAERKAMFWNVYEEIDVPGEMFVDHNAGKLYIYPYDSSKDVDMEVAALSGSIVELKGASYVTFDGIEFTGSKGHNSVTVSIQGDSAHNTIKNSKVYGNEGEGIGIYSTWNADYKVSYGNGGFNRIENCEIYQNGNRGVTILSGNTYADPPINAGCGVYNSSIHDNAVLYTGKTQIHLSGCGHTVDGCDVYNGPYSAIETSGSLLTIKNTSIHDINMSTADMGCIYNGRNISMLENRIENNHLFNMGFAKLEPTQAVNATKGGLIFTDDGTSFQYVKGNILGPNVGKECFGFKVNGGMGNEVTENIFIDVGCYASISDWNGSKMNEKAIQNKGYGTSWTQIADNKYWTEKYPVLAYGKDFANVYTLGNTVKNNAVLYIENTQPDETYRHTLNYSSNVGDLKLNGIETNQLFDGASKSLFTDWDNGNFKPTAEFYKQFAIDEIDYDKIGYNKLSKYAPAASNATVFSDSKEAVKAKYSYSDKDGDKEGNTFVEWYSANAGSDSFKSLKKYGEELEITPDLAGKKIRYVVTPLDENGVRGEAVTSEIMLISSEGDVDREALNDLISEASILANDAVVGTDDGCYTQEDLDEFNKAVAEAKSVANSSEVNQYQVDSAVKTLSAAIAKFKSRAIQNAEYMSIAGILKDTESWLVVAGSKDGFKDGTLTLTKGDRLTYTKEKYQNKIFTFNLEIKESEAAKPELGAAIYFGTVDADKQIWLTSGYDLWMKNTILECQRWPGNELYEFDNKWLKPGTKHKIAIGVSGTGNNQKYMLYIDGELVYQRTFDSKITGEGYFGLGCSGDMDIVITPVEVDFTSLNAKIAEAEKVSEKETGTLYGQYSAEKMAELADVIKSAKELKNDIAASQESADRKILELESAMAAVENSIVCEQEITESSSITLNEGKPNADFTINQGKKLTLSKGNNDSLPEINIKAETAKGDVNVKIKAGTKLSQDTFTAFESLAGPTGNVDDTTNVINTYVIGSSSGIDSDKLVKIVFPGAVNYRISYKSGSSYREITKRIRENTEAAALSAIDGKGAVKYVDGTDLVVYTNVLSEFILFTKSTSSDSNNDNNSSNNGGNVNNGTVNGGAYVGSSNAFYSSETTNPNLDADNFCFDDMINHWARADVMKMYNAGIVSGVSERLFEPDRNITRAEFAAIIARALKLTDRPANYEDVDSADWFAGYVGACSDAGIISGYGGMFRPNDNITRQEMAVIIVNAYAYLERAGANGGIDEFTDKSEIADWAKAAVDTASSVGLISGMGDGTFAPNANATRAQAASIVKRLLDK